MEFCSRLIVKCDEWKWYGWRWTAAIYIILKKQHNKTTTINLILCFLSCCPLTYLLLLLEWHSIETMIINVLSFIDERGWWRGDEEESTKIHIRMNRENFPKGLTGFSAVHEFRALIEELLNGKGFRCLTRQFGFESHWIHSFRFYCNNFQKNPSKSSSSSSQ